MDFKDDLNISYEFDDDGNKVVARIPIEEWEQIEAEIESLKELKEKKKKAEIEKFKKDLEEAFQEVADIEAGKSKGIPFDDLLKELDEMD